jgi:tRNA1(Val) A37 N6-methylase TrmN6
MENKPIHLTGCAHEAVRAVLAEGDIAVDATVGNGWDTLFLAKEVGPSGLVYGFDIQASALEAARRRLDAEGLLSRVTLFEAGHERMRELLPSSVSGEVKAILFNLGYLPGGSHAVTTMRETTLAALTASLSLLASSGILSVMCYPGHPEGAEECRSVEEWTRALDAARFSVQWVDSPPNPARPSPRLLLVRTVPPADHS